MPLRHLIDRKKGGPNLNAWVVALVMSLTVLISLVIGIVAAYGAVNAILYAFADQSQAARETQPVLMARKARAGVN